MREPAVIKIGMSAPTAAAEMFLGKHKMERVCSLRQVEEFTTTLHRIRRAGYAAAGVLVLFTLVCLALSWNGVNVVALYSAGAVVLLIHMVITCADYLREEKRAAHAYWGYLDTYSYEVLVRLARVSRLSAWSRYEIEKYLSVSHLVW